VTATGDTGNGNDGDNVVNFPATEAERRAMRKLQQDQERQKLVNVFVDEDRALFCDSDGVAYSDLIIAGHRETWPIKSREFRSAYIGYLRRQFDRLVGEDSVLAMGVKAGMSKGAVNSAIGDFEIRAIGTSVVRDVRVRIAAHGDDIYIDLCDADWRAVRVTAAGWSVVESPPVRFRRSPKMLPLPFPEHGGKVEALRPFLNVRTDADFTMMIAWVLAALRPRGPYPILDLYGEQGTAKTGHLRKLRSLIDPHTVETSGLPSGGRDLFIGARNSHMQAFSNISRLSDAMSDYLCRLATSGGLRTRALFTDASEVLFSGERPIAIEGIAHVVRKPDLLDRSIVMPVARLPAYKTERELQTEFECQRAGIFGALLTMVARGLATLPSTRLANPPRMADFAHWAVACGVAGFEPAYAANRQAAIDVMLEHDPLARALRAFMARRKEWRGTAGELLDTIGPAAGIRSAQAIADELRRLAAPLRTIGLNIVNEPRTKVQRPLRIEWVTPVTTTP